MEDWETMGEDDLDGDVLGDILGDDATVGAIRRIARKNPRAARTIARMLPARPSWRNRLAPGVEAPGVGLVPLPLTPSNGTGIFVAGTTAIDYTARPQKPFRGERVLALVGRSAGVPTSTRALGRFFVGTDVEQAQLGAIDLENFGPTAFGVRLKMRQAEPGVDMLITATVSAAIAMGESLSLTITILGHYVR